MMMMMEETHELPPGFRFHPTDEELITYYLSNKVSDFDFTTRAVADVDLNKCEPWDLPAKASMGEREWYFFSLRDRKYPTGLRTNRATEAGYWKTTGKDKEIFRGSALVGMKKTLVFYRGRAPKGEKTNWVMHEYRLDNSNNKLIATKDEWVVCRIFQKTATVKRPQQPPSSPPDDDDSPPSLGDIDLPPHFTMPMSPSPNNNINNYNNNNSDMNMNMMMSWNVNPQWPLLSTNLSMNSLLLTALQLRGGGGGGGADNYSFMNPFGSHSFEIASTSAASGVPPPDQPQPHYNINADDSNIW